MAVVRWRWRPRFGGDRCLQVVGGFAANRCLEVVGGFDATEAFQCSR
jgi:hypothetical protein